MRVGDELFNKSEIDRLYYPLSESWVRRQFHVTDVGARLSVRIDLASGGHIGSGKIALLEAIQAQGSISEAARAVGMTYRSAWQWVEEINGALHEPAVTAKAGGRKGGGAVLTPIGIQIVDRYRAMKASAELAVDAELRAIEALARDGVEE